MVLSLLILKRFTNKSKGAILLIIKIAVMTLLFLLVAFSILADLPIGEALIKGLDLRLYIKLVSIFGFLMVVFYLWKERRRLEMSQKYKRADEMLAQAEASVERKKQLCEQMEKRLQDTYEKKEQGLNHQIDLVREEYQARINQLKTQNMELKETVSNLMTALKVKKK